MDSEYDQKFEDMKKYIPFLESMIKRLESTNALSANPRQAQLDKIRSLRDLLLDKKKRMKMENLLKCEQVLINLYAKVEQRDALPKRVSGSSGYDSTTENNSNLEIVRNKLKRVSKIQDEAGTLPEIVRASDIDDVRTTGSVEPALFQRRPHKTSPTLSDISSSSQEKIKSPETNSTRKYTRVLISPERNVRSTSIESLDTVLFSRRSPSRTSSSYTKKEAKKTSTTKIPLAQTKDLNITLNVPEESLNSLNTKDILSRIITCNDNDVDIETLRGLRSQILSELNQTGAKDDISDLILKSYVRKKTSAKKKEDIEEGELSDSESEAIESIYGSLVLVDKDKSQNEEKSVPEKDQSRKIQICLVINSKNNCETSSKNTSTSDHNINDECDLEIFIETKQNTQIEEKIDQSKTIANEKTVSDAKKTTETTEVIIEEDGRTAKIQKSRKINTTAMKTESNGEKKKDENLITNDKEINKNDTNSSNNKDLKNESSDLSKENNKTSDLSASFKANFYKPLHEIDNAGLFKISINKNDNKSSELDKQDLSSILNKKENSVEIPLLNDPVIANKPVEKDIDAQIDILQALKNEILADNILTVPHVDAITPPLHQPKLTKVAGVQRLPNKKRISIEKYKEKTTHSNDIITSTLKDDNNKKQSLKLTEKECERFNLPAKNYINEDISSEEEGQKESKAQYDEVQQNCAPKSPDHDDSGFVAKTQPVIIPVDPVKTPIVNLNADIDMRTMPVSPKITPEISSSSTSSYFQNNELKKNDTNIDKIDDIKSPLIDPRMKKDININWETSNLAAVNLDAISKSLTGSNIIFNPRMTPSRISNSISYEMSVNPQKTESDLNIPHKHIYAPSCPLNEVSWPLNSERDFGMRNTRWNENDNYLNNKVSQTSMNTPRSSFVDPNMHDKNIGKSNALLADDRNEGTDQAHFPLTPLPLFGWSDNSGMLNQFGKLEVPMSPMVNFGSSDCPPTPTHPFGRPECSPTLNRTFNMTDRPVTPSHSFGRTDCPMTPIHPFGRTDCPMTPSHPFGRTDCPATPIHTFGRLDCPATPSHPFGRSDIPPTPSHVFGRSECSVTPNHSFGRIDVPPTPNNPFVIMDFPGTPNHPYGMSDCPTTPSHPFGRSDCPPTPIHSFGRLDCPQTPSHPFGMSECPKTPHHPFGRLDAGVAPNYSRADHSQSISLNKQFSKDPRLNRRSEYEYESRCRRDEKSRRSYNDRGFNTRGSFPKQSRIHGKSETYTNYDREGNDARRSRSISRSERNYARDIFRDKDQSNYSDRISSYKYDNRIKRREREDEERYRRDRSVEWNRDSYENVRSRYRERSLSKNNKREIDSENRLSIKPDAGRSFTIDTSVNSTFQDLLKKKELETVNKLFDSRKSRAASVGRSKISTFNKFSDISDEFAADNDPENRNKNYRRASSVGRDLQCDNDRSYQEVKTDFQNYKSNFKMFESAKDDGKMRTSKNTTSEDNQNDKKLCENQNMKSSFTKHQYTSIKNYRDPGMRLDCGDKNNYYGPDKKRYGISYSNDNMAKGAILVSGYGVKNYKIPKIKRPNTETQNNDNVNDEKTESVGTKYKNNKSKRPKDTKNKHISDESKEVVDGRPGRRITRSSKNHTEVKSTIPTKDGINIKRNNVIYDSSSEAETTKKEVVDNNISSDDEKSIKDLFCENNKSKHSKLKLNLMYNINENETFSDNVPVIDNINTLIDDLDNHIEGPIHDKAGDFTKDTNSNNSSNRANLILKGDPLGTAVKNNLNKDVDIKSICSDEFQENGKDDKDKKDHSVDTLLQPSSDESPKHSVEASEVAKEVDQHKKQFTDIKLSTGNSEISGEKTTSQNKININNEETVSTTGKESRMHENAGESIDRNIATSPADSTNEIIQEKPNEHIVPDSTNEVQGEINSLISSSFNCTNGPIKDFIESGSSRKEIVPPLDSIGSILSILQDKSKIHQLLNMLGKQSGDNNKLKRKLEKLSEIVFDDEDETRNHKDTKDYNSTDLTGKVTNADEEADKETLQCSGNKLEEIKATNDDSKNMDANSEDILNKEQTGIQSNNKSLTKNTPKIVTAKKKNFQKNIKGRFTKKNKVQRIPQTIVAQADKPPTVKKPSRELLKLLEPTGIKHHFSDETLNSTGIRKCRLAKLVDDSSTSRKEETTYDPKPVVVLEKFKNQDKPIELVKIADKSAKNKLSSEIKRKSSENNEAIDEDKIVNTKSKDIVKSISVSKPKSKASSKQPSVDPYEFETDSVDTNTLKESGSEEYSDIETNSLASSLNFGSSELLADIQKKTKRKRRGKSWQTGKIKPKNKNKKQTKTIETTETTSHEDSLPSERRIVIPDKECFVDKYYCFQKNVSEYSCRLCEYTGFDIVLHYKQQHPHTEIPLSRMNPRTAKEAVAQCQEVNFPAISKISTDKYVCRFCFKEFSGSKTVLESFFWHVVSMHTGEYKQACSECDPEPCSFNLDIPPPPKENKGQLIAYLCDKCNFTQVSLENLKTHVIGRHNDEQTDVYTINLSAMTRKTLKTLAKHKNTIAPRVLRSSLSHQSISENVDGSSEITTKPTAEESVPLKEERSPISVTKEKSNVMSIQSKIAFESDDHISSPNISHNDHDNSIEIKREHSENEFDEPTNIESHEESEVPDPIEMETQSNIEALQHITPDDIVNYPHFKVSYKESGVKEYVCCINGEDNHYKTSLLISMKKHVQSKHHENWDGYCYLCKVIITPQGKNYFKACLEHFIDQHMDQFPVLETVTEVFNDEPPVKVSCDVSVEVPKYINVRPLNQLISSKSNDDNATGVPIIESVVSLNSSVELPLPSPNYTHTSSLEKEKIKQHKYEEWQAEIMSKKHRVVLSAMMTPKKLIKVYKCTGRFCSFTSDNAEDALLHATTHQRIGGKGAMNCAYCDFDASNNGIDLVMHVFKAHGNCQYACGLCFYRALASQLVNSHMCRTHSNKQPDDYVLHTSTDSTPVTDDSDNILSREVAVPSYLCDLPSLEDDGGLCRFRAYTPTQFHEHLQKRHQPPYSCNMCSNVTSTASDLVNHMKEHGYRLYQCACCVYGADNEKDMLDHASACHPMRLPQAYLRLITNTGANPQLKVLPRVYLNKFKVPTKNVLSDGTDDPVREAERCIELEKLIGHVDTVTKSSSESVVKVAASDLSDPTEIIQDAQSLLTNVAREEADISSHTCDSVPTSEIEKHCQSLNQTEPSPCILKTESDLEAPSTNKSSDVVYCLDSDDEDSAQHVIELSDEDLISTNADTRSQKQKAASIKPHFTRLFVCPICKLICRNNGGLKLHLNTCNSTFGLMKCPHWPCPMEARTNSELIDHYTKFHTNIPVYVCGICNTRHKSVAGTKLHMKSMHKSQHFARTPVRKLVGKTEVFVINTEERPPKTSLTRKLSAAADNAKRYGPQDVGQLPINPILDSLVYCSLCEFSTKVRLNMVRHLQLHAQQQPAPQTAPVNPVPHLETNERHFDKMLNLASSSIVNRVPEKVVRLDPVSSVAPVPVEDAGRYPKFVAERQRFTCGAKGCSYISVDEAMFRCHWDTLHSSSVDYHCVHCPSYQYLDTSRPLTSARIISHLKMHDDTLYSCSACSFYHYKRPVMEKHVSVSHKDALIITLRQDGVAVPPSTSTPVPAPPSSAATMDLKPWQCGLCEFKSMLRPEVVDHCSKVHQSKMQYKCNYCPFRTSAVENVTKHQSNSHPEKGEDVFYYYYREGSITDEDGTPRWMKQSQKSGISEPVVKSEVPEPSTPQTAAVPVTQTHSLVAVDLNLVKREIEETETIIEMEQSIEELCKKFGEFCEPKGTQYKCPLCTAVVEDTAEAMQSHLYEELKYRKWGCSHCSYKAFHKTGLNKHMFSEHRRRHEEPIELQTDVNIEKWVNTQLEFQSNLIEKNRLIQNLPSEDPAPSTSKTVEQLVQRKSDEMHSDLENAFGSFGSPRNSLFCCPKCNCTLKDEKMMKEHLESELSKIRWCCSACSFKSQIYHETQFHCKTAHINEPAQPVEAMRNPAVRAAWVQAVLRRQKQTIKLPTPEPISPEKKPDLTDPHENSLLVVRYEERVPTPEDTVRRKRPAPADSDDEKLVIDESEPAKKKLKEKTCPHCDYKSKWSSPLKEHILKHYNLKPYTCGYCDFMAQRYMLVKHIQQCHPGKGFRISATPIPSGPPLVINLPKLPSKKSDPDYFANQICLHCERAVPDIRNHTHNNVVPEFAQKGEVVVKCCICLALRLDVTSLQEHHNARHGDVPINYAFYKLHCETRECYFCELCNGRFSFLKDLKSHHKATHNALPLKYTTSLPGFALYEEEMNAKRKNEDVTLEPNAKRIAKKSTTRLPFANAVAKKSTTKLPFNASDELGHEIEYSFYGTKPTPINDYPKLCTLMPIGNALIPCMVKHLRKMVKIEPVVQVKDAKEEIERMLLR